MRDTLIPLILGAVVSLGILAYFHNAPLRARADTMQKTARKLAPVSGTTSSAHREQCTKLAREVLDRTGWGKVSRAILVNYYSERVNKCLIEIKTIDIVNTAVEVFINKSLEDAE